MTGRNSMKILIIRNFPSYMAVKNNTYNIQEVGLAKALVRKGNTCDIVFWTDKEEEIVEIPVDEVGTVHVFYRHGKTFLKNTVFQNCEELYSQYDVLQPCEYNQIQAWMLAKRYPEKVIIYHGPYYSKFNKRYNLMCKVFDILFLPRYIKLGTPFLVKSNLAKEFLVNKGIKECNVHTVGVGIDTQMLTNAELVCNDTIYKKMAQDSSSTKILYVGRFEERRNIKFLLDIFQKVHQQDTNAKLYMIGTGEKEYLDSCFSYMKEIGIADHVVWQEKMEQKFLSRIYQLSDFFLLPTEYEIFGMVLLEAMYYKNVVLTTVNGGSSTLMQYGENGFVFTENNASMWANCILNLDKNKMKSIQDNAHQTIAAKYTWDALADRFIENYQAKINH